jgi:Circularly permutated YpsA SLOG family
MPVCRATLSSKIPTRQHGFWNEIDHVHLYPRRGMGFDGIKWVSGGQTRADRAALDFAIERGIPHGGEDLAALAHSASARYGRQY